MSGMQFSCPACQRSYTWKPELAGRKAKCKCGHEMTVPAQSPAAAGKQAAPQNNCPSCGQPLAPKAALCVGCGYDLRTGKKIATGIADTPAAPAPAPTAAPTRRSSAVPNYPMSRRPTQEEPTTSTAKYVILGGILLLVAMGVGGWIIFRSTGGDANKPRLGDDAQVEEMIADDYPKDLTDWVEANPARMLGGKNTAQAVTMEKNLKSMGATKVLAFGNGVLCLCIAIELPDDPAKRQAIFNWHNQGLIFGELRTKDVGQRYILHKIGL